MSLPDPAHEVFVPCNCGDIEHCRMETYVSDVRLLERRFLLVAEGIERIWASTRTVVAT